jgi:hypothetical protein
MQNPTDVSDETEAIAAIGGDPLAGSGFETEESDPGFTTSEPFPRRNHVKE